MNLNNVVELINETSNKSKTDKSNFLDRLESKLDNITDTYIYVKSLAKYYWVEARIFFSPSDVCHNLIISQKELSAMRQYGLIETHDSLVYKKG
jgi:hypothetical protein